MPRPPIEVGRPWIALLVAFGAIGVSLTLFAGADEAALAVPTLAERLDELADGTTDGHELLVVPREVPPGWDDPGIETARAGDRLVRFELRFVRRFPDPHREGAFLAVRTYLCSAYDPDPCLRGRTEVARTVVGRVTTVVTTATDELLDEVTAAWADVEPTSDWRALDWPTRLR